MQDRRAISERLSAWSGKVAQDREINIVLGKTLRILGHAEFF